MTRAILTDIEGTTSSISFVKDVLFPYAHERMAAFVRDEGDDERVRALLDEAKREAGEPALTDDEVVAVLRTWIEEDRKLTPLKSLQGRIWERGYRDGHLVAHVYPEVADHLRAWKEQGLALHVYSSGSVEAQALFFGHCEAGDLTPLFSGYFDTRTGPKKEAASYARIAEEIDLPPGDVLFLSDVVEELDAARAAGMQTCWLVRDGETPRTPVHPLARDFSEVEP